MTLEDITPAKQTEAGVQRRRKHSFARAVVLLLIALGMTILASFQHFLLTMAPVEQNDPRPSEGIVVLTGGADRISDALDILQSKRAHRLLITGVNLQTSEASLIRQAGHRDLFDCCVDLDRRALNTEGNAREAAHWARKNGYKSLIVVTSSYHMPRALVELRRFLPNAELLPNPVISESGDPQKWWSDMRVTRLMFVEFSKYLGARLRAQLYPVMPL